MKSFIIKSSLIALAAALPIMFIEYDQPFSKYNDLLSAMVSISAAIFAAVGIWLAYLYPEAISGLTKSENVTFIRGSEHIKKIEVLVLNIISSSVVLVACLGVRFFQIFNSAGIEGLYLNIARGLGLYLILFSCVIQFYSLFSIVLVNVSFLNRLYNVITEKSVNDDL